MCYSVVGCKFTAYMFVVSVCVSATSVKNKRTSEKAEQLGLENNSSSSTLRYNKGGKCIKDG